MPIYDYACVACDERFDELLRFDAPPPPCPVCGADETERLLSPFQVPNSSAGQRNYIRRQTPGIGCDSGGCGTHAH